MKQLFIKTHRILGSILSLIFLMWFLSGFVMIFSGFPHAKRQNAFEQSEPLSLYKDQIIWPTDSSYHLDNLTLKVTNQTPTFTTRKSCFNARTWQKINHFKTASLDSMVQARYKSNIIQKKILTNYDTWIPWKSYKAYFPIHKYYMADGAKTQVYVSSTTGTVVQESTLKQRCLAYFGAIPHWFYFKSLRLEQDLWAKVIIWISGIGAIMCLTGIVVGIYRSRKWRKIKKKGLMSLSPYKKKWFRWHHILGMTFGIFTFTFVLSGMFSLTGLPQWLMPMDNSIDYRALWHEKASVSNFTRSIQDVLAPKALSTAKQIQFTQIDSNSYYLVYTKYRVPIFINARTGDSLFIKTFSYQEIASMVKQKFANYAYSIEKMTESDNYYNTNGNTVAKIRFQDQNKTWIYISTATPHQLRIIDKNTRFRRWLYKALHTFNFPKVREFEWLRITLLLIANTLGTLVSITSVALAYGYFKRKLRKHRRKRDEG